MKLNEVFMYAAVIKRILDLEISIVLMPLLIIIFAIVAFLIKLEDGGHIFYKSVRLGQNMREFKMYKFRTMVENAPDIRNSDGTTYNSSNDSRVTRIGRILRETSIDETAQLINVIKGDMSLVGPRPSPLGNMHLYSKEYLKKFSVKPGITGYNQAFFRNSASLSERQKNDVYYIENFSFKLDCKIIFKTFFTVLKRESIYNSNNNQ